jgi:hypothetical protein
MQTEVIMSDRARDVVVILEPSERGEGKTKYYVVNSSTTTEKGEVEIDIQCQ